MNAIFTMGSGALSAPAVAQAIQLAHDAIVTEVAQAPALAGDDA